MKITVNPSAIIGKIKPFHAINNAPLLGTSDQLFHYLGEAGIPYSRLHDTGGAYGGFRFVDIANIFRDWNADPSDPAAYDFAFTDWLLEKLTEQGVEPFFRLGATIENAHYIRAYRIFPPVDNRKWAQICAGIIRHYNHGWADGYRYHIRYWEIWNEPDNEPEIRDNPMWKGTREQYFALYETAANYLKEQFPDIKIGGYGSCGFYALNDAFQANANSSPRTDYFITFFQEFLDYIAAPEHTAPLDFFSWHSYADSRSNARYAAYVRRELDRRGLTATESILDEWNPGIQRRGTEEDACFIADMLLRLHNSPLDMLMYYDGQVHGSYQGLFDPVRLTVFPAYYALQAFGELYALGGRVTAEADGELPLLAAADPDEALGKLLIVNTGDIPIPIEPCLPAGWRITRFRLLNGGGGLTDTPMDSPDRLTLPAKKLGMLEYAGLR